MKITKRQLKRIIREEYSRLKRKGLIREFGEDDAQLRRKIQNRERMIGRGMDAGTMPFNPSFDYDSKPAPSKMRYTLGDELSQVEDVIKQNPMHAHYEVEGTRDPNVLYIKSGDLSVKVVNDYGTFRFSVVLPRKWKGWSMECESIDVEIDNVLYELSEYINVMEGNQNLREASYGTTPMLAFSGEPSRPFSEMRAEALDIMDELMDGGAFLMNPRDYGDLNELIQDLATDGDEDFETFRRLLVANNQGQYIRIYFR